MEGWQMSKARMYFEAGKFLFLHLLCLPMDMVALWVLYMSGVREKSARFDDQPAMVFDAPPWLARRWRYSVTLGHVVLMHPDHGHAVLAHELVHVLQAEAACVAWWLATLIAWSPTMALLSPLAWLAIYGASCAAAWLAGREAYRGSVFEEHARAEVEQ